MAQDRKNFGFLILQTMTYSILRPDPPKKQALSVVFIHTNNFAAPEIKFFCSFMHTNSSKMQEGTILPHEVSETMAPISLRISPSDSHQCLPDQQLGMGQLQTQLRGMADRRVG